MPNAVQALGQHADAVLLQQAARGLAVALAHVAGTGANMVREHIAAAKDLGLAFDHRHAAHLQGVEHQAQRLVPIATIQRLTGRHAAARRQ